MRFKKLGQRIKIFFLLVLPDPHRKPVVIFLLEYLKISILNRKIAGQYFRKFLYHKGAKKITQYFTTENLIYKCWDLNDRNYTQITDNKQVFEDFFSKLNINIVRRLANNNKNYFNINNNNFLSINTSIEFSNFLTDLIHKNPGLNGFFIKKTIGSYGGANIFKISKEDLNTKNGFIEKIYQEVIKSEYLFQNIIIQHEKMNLINSGCINTIRIDTYTNKNKVSKVFSSFLRVGLNNSCVDNVSCGGMFVGINIENGILFPEAFQMFEIGRGKKFSKNPENNMVFGGFKVPFFLEAKELSIKAAECVPQLRVVGWDIAITPEGPILIEGNSKPSIGCSETSQNGFSNNPIFMELFTELYPVQQ